MRYRFEEDEHDVYDHPGTWLFMAVASFAITMIIVYRMSVGEINATSVIGALLSGGATLYALGEWAEARRG